MIDSKDIGRMIADVMESELSVPAQVWLERTVWQPPSLILEFSVLLECRWKHQTKEFCLAINPAIYDPAILRESLKSVAAIFADELRDAAARYN